MKLLRHFKKKKISKGRCIQIIFHVLVFQIFLVVNANAQTNDEKLNLKFTNVTLEHIFSELESNTTYRFRFTDEIINDKRKVTYNFRNKSLDEILSVIGSDAGLEYKFDNKTISVKKAVKKVVRGKITDTETDEALIGVNITIKGSSDGTTTDINGAYIIEAYSNAVLMYSYVGYETIEKDIEGDYMDIAMIPAQLSLDEVVVVGYGSLNKRDITSSISSINSEDFSVGAYSGPMQMLQGLIPGLNITNDGDPTSSATSIILRGASTLRTGEAQEPFYVIDGIPGASLDVVALDDIVSIDILRDASAAAIYGTRAANGVIIITTKNGQSKSKVSYSSYMAIETISNKIDMCSADEYRSYLSSNGLSLDPENDDGANIDWQDEITRIGISHNNNLSFSGKNNNTSYFASVNYQEKEGIIKNTSLDRLTLRAKIDQKTLNNKLLVGLSIANTITKTEQISNEDELFESILKYLPTVNIKNEDGTFRENYNYASYNPVALIEQNTNERKNNVFLGSLHAQLNIMENLNVKAVASYQNNNSSSGIYYSKDSRLAYGLDGYGLRSSFEDEKKVLEITSNYNKTINSHRINILLGYSWQEDKNGNGFQTTNIGFISDATGYYNLGLASPPEGYFPDYGTTSMTTLRIISGFARLNYHYKNKYLMQATVRRDGSSAFGKNNQWGTFPSISAGWRISEESFMDNIQSIDEMKVRVGYGVSGNSLGFSPLISQLRYSSSGKFYYNGDYISGIFPSQNANPDLKWETTSILNIGLDWAALNNRFSGTVEYYNKLTEDLIWTYPVSSTVYYVGEYTANVGSIRNKGFEITLSGIPLKNKNFAWNTMVTFSSNKNEVESLSNDEFQLDYIITAPAGDHGQSGLYTQIIEEGYPIGQFHLLKYAGRDENGISQFYAADGSLTTSPTSEDYYYAGDAQPDAVFGWQNSVSYKSWALDFLFRGVTGNKILNTTLSNLNFPAEATHYNLPTMTLNEPVNDTRAHYTSTRYLEDGDYIRLDNITLSYTFDAKNLGIRKLKLYASINNVFVITDYKGLDPEINLGGLTPGVDNDNYYPKTRTFMLGVNVDF